MPVIHDATREVGAGSAPDVPPGEPVRSVWLLVRSTPLLPLIGGCVAAIVVVAARAATSIDALGTTLVLACILSSVGVGAAFDDPAAEVLAASPASLRRRQLTRLALATGVVAGTWCTIAVVAVRDRPAAPFGARALAVDLVVLLLIGAATSSAVRRRHGSAGGVAGMAVVVLAPLVASALAFRWPEVIPTLAPDAPHRERLLVVGALAASVLARSSRDPVA